MYNIGDRIVYPMHGAGIIEAIEEREVLDEVNKYYILRMPYDDMTVMLPISGIAADSIRDVISPEEADKVIKYFDDFFEEVSSNWNKRYRENIAKIKSGNIYEVAGVVKMLLFRDKTRGLSSGERKMLTNAKQILISELVIAKSTTQEKIENTLSDMVDKFVDKA
ncbi:MAG: CarD family transcriptional regulator [Clostridia bacterium]|nr:CarD family transcriptional regulator [Clostridia bacterium]MBR6638639.1 CarD family transcriptional regulator [Lachnospiraceae bacterium]